ncbi:zinc ribbon domain-containing protein [Streptomyces sp. NBC_00005]|uniref:zinc ribbon domain-containing protein n=1 Tax=Streptomyces sp. NBC_00005 TaxID=2903609 RepID=UPI00324BC221
MHVDPAYTSRTCAECGHIDRANRVSQAWFACRSCGFVDHADRWGHLPLERSREWGRLPQHPRPCVGVVATRGRVNGPRPTPTTAGGLDANAASHPVTPVVQTRRLQRRVVDPGPPGISAELQPASLIAHRRPDGLVWKTEATTWARRSMPG